MKGKVDREQYLNADYNIISICLAPFALGCSFKMANSGDSCPEMDSRTLVNHMTTHSSGKNLFKIGRCKKVFDQAGSLNNCKLSHSGKKSHKCVQCNKSFVSASHLRDACLLSYLDEFSGEKNNL